MSRSVLGWETIASIVAFTRRFIPLFQLAFDRIREVRPGSVPALASTWLKWSSSFQLLSLLDLVAEFIDRVWTPFALAADARDEHYDTEGQFKVFSRPRRVLEQLMVVESICEDVKS